MAPVPGFQFDRLLRAMDAASFERFVADLWRARGRSVEHEDGVLVVENPTAGDRLTVEVRAVPWWRPRTPTHPPSDADLAVVNRRVPGRSDAIVDVADLREVVSYAVDPATREELFSAHLDRSGSPTGWAVGRLPPVTPARLAVASVGLAVLLAAAMAGPAYLPPDQPATGSVEANEDVDLPDVEIDPDSAEAFAATRWPGGAGGFPPGLAPEGIEDPAALASTHVDRTGSRPYELELTVREFEGDRPVGSYEERIAVRSDWTFVSRVDAAGDVRADHPLISAVEMYSAGNGVFVHVDPDRSLSPRDAMGASPGDVSGLENRVERYLAVALSTEESAVVDTSRIGDTTFHRVNGTAEVPDGGTANVTALVTAGGTVHEVRVERGVVGSDRSVVVTLEYEFGSVDVRPPDWLGNDSAVVGRNLPLSKR